VAARAPRPTPGRVISIVGTRPEAIKMAPVVRAIGRRAVEQRVILTGQHPGLSIHFDAAQTVDLAADRPI
jgi:UDP-N-acetylglucosamine 2-epimerase